MKELNKHIERIKKICDSNNVGSLFAFGSVTTDQLQAESDIDLLVKINDDDPFSYSDNYFNLKFQLQELFNRNIDLMEEKSLNNPYLKHQIDETKGLIYGK